MSVPEAISGHRILLMGCGAVGGVIAAGLLSAEHDVSIVTGNQDITQAVESRGLRVTTPERQRTVSTTVHNRLDELSGHFDAIYLAMKATEVEQAARDAAERSGRYRTLRTPGRC